MDGNIISSHRCKELNKILRSSMLDHSYQKPFSLETSNDLIVPNQQENDQENLEKDLFKTIDASVDSITPIDCNRIHFSDNQTKINDFSVDATTDKLSIIEATKNLTKSTVEPDVTQRVDDDFLENVYLDLMKNTERDGSKNVNNSVNKSTSNEEIIKNNFFTIHPKLLSLNNPANSENNVKTQDKTGSPGSSQDLYCSKVIQNSSVGVLNDPNVTSQKMCDDILELTRTTQVSAGLKQFLYQIIFNEQSMLYKSDAQNTLDNGQTMVPSRPPSLVNDAQFNEIQSNCISSQYVNSFDKMKSIQANAETKQIDPQYRNSNEANGGTYDLSKNNNNSNSDDSLMEVEHNISPTSKVLHSKIIEFSGQIPGQSLTNVSSLGVDLIAEIMVQLFNLGQTKSKFLSVIHKIHDEKVLDEVYEFLHKQTQDKTTNCNILYLDSTNRAKTSQRKDENHGVVNDSDKEINTITDIVMDQNAVDSDKSIQNINKCFDSVKDKYNVTELKELRVVATKIDDGKTNKRTRKVIKSKFTFVRPLCKKLACRKNEKIKAKKIKTKLQTSKILKENSNVILDPLLVCDENISLSKEVIKNQERRVLNKLNGSHAVQRKSPIHEMKKNKSSLEVEKPIKKGITGSFVWNIIKSHQSIFDDAKAVAKNNDKVCLPKKTIQSTKKQVVMHNQSKEPEKCHILKSIENKSKTSPKVSKQRNHIDKEYFPTAMNVLKCKFCKFRGANLPIVEHYKEMHKDEEVLPSRVSDACAKKLINESIKQQLGLMNGEQMEETGSDKRKREASYTFYTCLFCCKNFNDIGTFSDHIAAHTGEYSYQCQFCNIACPSVNHFKEHRQTHSTKYKTRGVVFRLVYPNPVPVKTLFGYLCPFCNFTQLNYASMTKHMSRYHLAEDKKPNGRWTVIRINMSYDKFNVYDSASSVDYSNLVGCRPPLNHEENHDSVTSNANVLGGDALKTTSISTRYKMNLNRSPLSAHIYEKLFNNHLANAIVNDTEPDQNAKKDTVKQPKTALKLRVRHLPGDKLSSSHLKSNVGGKSVSDASPLKANNRMNKSDNRTAIDCIRIYNVRTLKEFQDDDSTGKSVSNENTEKDDIVLKMSVVKSFPRRCEDLMSTNEGTAMTLQPGQQIVNNGQLIDGKFAFIETADKKTKEKRFELCHINMSKSVLASHHTMAALRPLGLFKCSEKSCRQIYTNVESYKRHMLVHYSRPKTNRKREDEQYKLCCYCYKPFDDIDSLIDHVVEKYTHCLYFCQYCLYRAYTPTHVLAHETKLHAECKPLIIQMEIDDQRNLLKEMLLAVDYNKFVLPYTCNQEKSCLFSCYVADDFITHLHDAHGTHDTFSCYKCTNQSKKYCNFSLHHSTSILHFEVHGISTYQCIFCLFGADSTEKIILHMAMEHFEYDLICVERHLKDDCSDSTKIENLKAVRLNSSIPDSVLKKMVLPKPLPEISPDPTMEQQAQYTNTIDITMSTPSFNHFSSTTVGQSPVMSVKSPTTMDDGIMIIVSDDEVTRPQCSGTKRKRSVEDSNTVAGYGKSVKSLKFSPKVYKKRLTFNTGTVDQNPVARMLSDPLSCDICSYSTKVRSNLLKHLKSHDKGQDSTIVKIINPITYIGNSKRTVNKKSRSSASHKPAVATAEKAQTEMKMKTSVEISPSVSLEHTLYPKFVKISSRYKCPVPNCTFNGANLKIFRAHLVVKHFEYTSFTCPHCPEDFNNNIKLNKIGNHLMYHSNNLYRCYYCPYIHFTCTQVKWHMKNDHSSQIRKDDRFGVIVLRGKKKSDHSTDNPQELSTIRWTCDICNFVFMSVGEIDEHKAHVHDLKKTYKCSVCFLEHDDPKKFKEHFQTKHPLLTVEHTYFQTYKQSEPAIAALKKAAESPNDKPEKNRKSDLTDNFNKNASLGTIKSNDQYLCPKCNDFQTDDVDLFREHVYKEIEYKTQWKCTGCDVISDSLKDLYCWETDNCHGTGDNYELIEDVVKFNWVERVVKHQTTMLRKFNEKAHTKETDRVDDVLTVIDENDALAFEDILRIIQNENRPIRVAESNTSLTGTPDE